MKPSTLLSLAIPVLTLVALRAGVAQTPAIEAGYAYLSPVPSASYVAPETRYVLVRLADVRPRAVVNLSTDFIRVIGEVSGVHAGVTRLGTDGRTIRYELAGGFEEGEFVRVALNPELAAGVEAVDPFIYRFRVGAPMPGEPSSLVSEEAPIEPPAWTIPDSGGRGDSGETRVAEIRPNGVAVPSDFPRAIVTAGNASPGYLFLENGFGLPSGYGSYTMILDNHGDPVWYRRGRMWDFKPQPNGLVTGTVEHGMGFPAFDSGFEEVGLYDTVNGYVTDGHDLEVFPNGGYLVMGYRYNRVDLSRYYVSGATNASVKEGVIQEFGVDGGLLFQWRSWDYYAGEIPTAGPDFPHMNALAIDVDGHILVSSRHLSEVTKIDRNTGEILWRLGGPASSFTFPDDPFGGPSWQHDITPLGGGRYLLFDNGVTHDPQVSRAVEYELDLAAMTARMVWQYRETPDLYTHWMGSAQRLTNGRTLINFVGVDAPVAIEVDTNGVKQFEMSLVPGAEAYRVFRGDWKGTVAAPYLVAERRTHGVGLICNKFGDPNVQSYRVYAGVSPGPTNLVATSASPLISVTNVVNGVLNYFRVTAVSHQGVESAYSNEEALLLRGNPLPDGELVANGKFDAGETGWTWKARVPAAGEWVVTNGISWFRITSGGAYLDALQLDQSPLSLVQGLRYQLSFDAWSRTVPRIMEVRVQGDTGLEEDYSQIQPFTITPLTNRFKFDFTMQAPTDSSARLVFNVGALPVDAFIDNVSLRVTSGLLGDFDGNHCVGWSDLEVLSGQWGVTADGMKADLNADGTVDFRDLVIFGNQWSGDPFCP